MKPEDKNKSLTEDKAVDSHNLIPEPVSPDPTAHEEVEANVMGPAGGHRPRLSEGLAKRGQRNGGA